MDLEMVGAVFILFGVFFNFIAVLGVLRLPDAYTRLHASGKVATLGFFGLLVGVSFLEPSMAPRAIALGLFAVAVAPVVSHVIALSEQRFQETRFGGNGRTPKAP
ncbi:MAG: monovalent cation/H(+) antiporter subunit G [Anaerolineales bacterium]